MPGCVSPAKRTSKISDSWRHRENDADITASEFRVDEKPVPTQTIILYFNFEWNCIDLTGFVYYLRKINLSNKIRLLESPIPNPPDFSISNY
jgi:hypothetical protein